MGLGPGPSGGQIKFGVTVASGDLKAPGLAMGRAKPFLGSCLVLSIL